jgi:hypothetical protein
VVSCSLIDIWISEERAGTVFRIIYENIQRYVPRDNHHRRDLKSYTHTKIIKQPKQTIHVCFNSYEGIESRRPTTKNNWTSKLDMSTQDWNPSWLDILCLIHLITHKVKSVNLNVPLVRVTKDKRIYNFCWVISQNNKIWVHFDLLKAWFVFKVSRTI